MNKTFLFLILIKLLKFNLGCPPSVSYQADAWLPNATSISSPSTTYNNFKSYGNNCGHNKYWNVGDSGFIVGGVEAYKNEFPHLVAIWVNGEYPGCAGVIISS